MILTNINQDYSVQTRENSDTMNMSFDSQKILVGFDMDLTLNDHRGIPVSDGVGSASIYRGGGYDAFRLIACRLNEKYGESEFKPPTDQELDYSHRELHQQADVFAYHFPDADLDEIRKLWDSIPHPNSPIDGAPETIQYLSEEGYPLFILTSRPEANINERLEECGISPESFLFIISTEKEEIKKPDLRVFTVVTKEAVAGLELEGAEHLDLKRAVYIGDHPNDYQAAEKARQVIGGPKGIVVPSGYFSIDNFLKRGIPQESIIEDIAQLPEYLKRLEVEIEV